MIFSIALKDFLNNFVSARFIIGFILCLILIPFTIVIGIQEYKSRQQIYEVERKEAEESMQVRVYSALRPVVVKPHGDFLCDFCAVCKIRCSVMSKTPLT